ncbi:MAG: hypothetical protein AAB116_16950 [Candidatus Poribacteria bacterium]
MSETAQNLLSSSTPPVTVCVPVRNGSKKHWEKMEEIRKQFVVNERNRKVAVQIDIDTFNKISVS